MAAAITVARRPEGMCMSIPYMSVTVKPQSSTYRTWRDAMGQRELVVMWTQGEVLKGLQKSFSRCYVGGKQVVLTLHQ